MKQRIDRTKENNVIKEWIQTCPGEFSHSDVLNGVRNILPVDKDKMYKQVVQRCICNIIQKMKDKQITNDIKAYKHQLKLVREDISNQLKNKDKVIANLNDKIVELNRLVGNRSSSARTFSLGEMAKVTSFKK